MRRTLTVMRCPTCRHTEACFRDLDELSGFAMHPDGRLVQGDDVRRMVVLEGRPVAVRRLEAVDMIGDRQDWDASTCFTVRRGRDRYVLFQNTRVSRFSESVATTELTPCQSCMTLCGCVAMLTLIVALHFYYPQNTSPRQQYSYHYR